MIVSTQLPRFAHTWTCDSRGRLELRETRATVIVYGSILIKQYYKRAIHPAHIASLTLCSSLRFAPTRSCIRQVAGMSQELFSNWPVSIIEGKGARFEWRALNAHKAKHSEDTAHMPPPRSIAERKEGSKRILKRAISGERSTRNRDNRFNVVPAKPPNESCRARDVPVNRRASTRAVPSSRAGNRPSLPSRSGSSTPECVRRI
jgi:hypothetical protein